MGYQKLRISVKAYESTILDSTCVKILDAVKASGIEAIGPIPLPTKLRRYCVLTSPHVNKKARDHFEIRTHKRIIDNCPKCALKIFREMSSSELV
jgi:small subunit ribosomal protein S10